MSVTSRCFCESIRFIGLLQLNGTYTWGTFIALFRVLYITAQNFLKKKIGVGNLLMVMVITGISEVNSQFIWQTIWNLGPS